jgi:PAS domain S-box-containing protein
VQQNDSSVRELRGIVRDLVALATTPAVWVGRSPAQIAESFADIVLHTLRAQAVYVSLQPPQALEAVRGSNHTGLIEEIRRVRGEAQPAALLVETVTRPEWPDPLRVAIQPIGLSGDQGFVAVACSDRSFPNEAESLLLSVAANQLAVALQTARLRAEAELERHRLKYLLAQAPAAIGLMTGPEHRWSYVNDHYVRITGRESAADFVGKSLRESLPEMESQPFIGLLDEVYRTGEPYVGRETKAYLNRTQSGQSAEGYFDFVYQPVRTAEGAVQGILVHAVEVTDKVVARREVERNEERLRLAQDAAQIGTWEWDPSTGHQTLSPELHQLFGTDAHDVNYVQKWAERIFPADFQNVQQLMNEGYESGEMEIEYRYQHPHRGLRWFYCKGRRQQGATTMFGIIQDITQRKLAENALRESENRYRTVAETASDAIITIDEDSTIHFVNSSVEEVFGYCPEELIGKNLTILMPDYMRHLHEAGLRRYLETGQRHLDWEATELPGLHKTGREIPLEVSFGEYKKDGRHFFTGFARDISERKKSEEALRRSEEEFRGLANSMPQLVWMANPDGWIFWYNQRWYEYTGTTPEKMEGWGWQSVHDPAVLPSVLERWRLSIATGQPFEMTFPLRGRDGVFRPFLTRVTPIRDNGGNITRWFGTNTDISVEIKVQQRLERALVGSQRLAAIVASSDDAIVSKDLNGIVTSWNSAAERILGYTADEMIGRSILTIIPPELHSDEPRILATIARGERIEHFETVRLTKSGRRIDVSLTISPVKDEEGRIVGAAKILRDITEQKRMAATLQRSEKLAAVGRLAATMAHEINNPLESVTNLLFLARKDHNISERTREYLQLADQELDRVAHVARQTLGFYRDNSAPLLFKVSPVISDLVDVYSYRFRNRDVRIEKELDDTAEVFAPVGEFRQVFSNLLVNAIDALPSNGGRIRIRAQAAHDRNGTARSGVRLTVADTGCGIPPESMPRIFESFYTTKRDIGTGLGLWLTRSIVQKHGGRIHVRSRVQTGTVFSVFWPREATQSGHGVGITE